MKSWAYDIGDVLLIHRKEQEVIVRVAGYADQLDNTKPLYCNLRTIDDAGWKRSEVKVQASQIIKLLPTWEKDRHEKYEADLKAWCDAQWAKMSDADKRRVHQDAIRLGIAQPDRRSPIERMIDEACGL